MKPFTICIGRQLGAGGRTIGKRIAEILSMEYYDKEILAMAARESGYSEELFAKQDEKKGFFANVMRSVSPFSSGGVYYGGTLSDAALFELQTEAIRKAAADHNCIFIGRAADYVLRDFERMVSVFISADEDDRLQRVCQFDHLDEYAAHKRIEKIERKRAAYYNFYTGKRWGDAASYDLCVNSSRLGYEQTAQFIADFTRHRLADIEAQK